MVEEGLRNREYKRWIEPKPECDTDKLSAESVTIYEIVAGTCFLLMAIIFAGTILLIENHIFDYFHYVL